MEKEFVGKIGESIRVHVSLRDHPDGTFTANCHEIPGCSISAESEEEATALIKEAVEACVAMLVKEGSRILDLQSMTA